MQMDNWLDDPFFDELSRRFFTPFTDARATATPVGALRTDIQEQDDRYVATVDVPGVNKDDIHLSYRDNVLTVNVNRQAEQSQRDDHGQTLMHERSAESMTRDFELPHVDAAKIKAAYRDGVLTITLPKVTQDVDQHQIDIQ